MTKQRIDAAIKHTGLELTYTRGDGYFYFLDGEGNQVGDSVYVCYMNQLPLDQWVLEAEHALTLGIQ